MPSFSCLDVSETPLSQGKQSQESLASIVLLPQGRFEQSPFVINVVLKAVSLWPGEINWPEMRQKGKYVTAYEYMNYGCLWLPGSSPYLEAAERTPLPNPYFTQ